MTLRSYIESCEIPSPTPDLSGLEIPIAKYAAAPGPLLGALTLTRSCALCGPQQTAATWLALKKGVLVAVPVHKQETIRVVFD